MDVSTYPPSSPPVGPSLPPSVADSGIKLEQLAALMPPVAARRRVLDGAFAVLGAGGSIRVGKDHICAPLTAGVTRQRVLRPQATSGADWRRADRVRVNPTNGAEGASKLRATHSWLSAPGAAQR